MSATGNDFIVINDVSVQHHLDWSAFAAQVCPRKVAVGADGVLILQHDDEADFLFRIFNADGSEAQMCGNGARCAAVFAFDNGLAGSSMRFTTLAGIISAKIDPDGVSIQMTDPSALEHDIFLSLHGREERVHSINTGVPHALVYTDNLSRVPVDTLGRVIRTHERFAPEGTNVDFVQVLGPHRLKVRTYERGVEAETLACGTGAVASAIMSTHLGLVSGPKAHVEMPGGELSIAFSSRRDAFRDVWLTGGVKAVYTGEVFLNP